MEVTATSLPEAPVDIHFPLYDMLHREIKGDPKQGVDLTHEEKSQLISDISGFDSRGHSFLFLIIRKYYLKNTDSAVSPFYVPYTEKISETSYRFDLDKLPVALKRMIKRFAVLHTSAQKNYRRSPPPK